MDPRRPAGPASPRHPRWRRRSHVGAGQDETPRDGDAALIRTVDVVRPQDAARLPVEGGQQLSVIGRDVDDVARHSRGADEPVELRAPELAPGCQVDRDDRSAGACRVPDAAADRGRQQVLVNSPPFGARGRVECDQHAVAGIVG